MKFRKLFLSLILSCCSVFALFGLTGCGETSLATVVENFNKLDSTYQEYDEVFQQGECEGMTTDYLIKYGTIVDSYVGDGKDGYVELQDMYNTILVVSSDYIDNNKEYIKNLTEENLTNSSKKALTQLNNKLVAYTKEIKTFVAYRRDFVEYFEQTNGEFTDTEDQAYLRKFKKSYGTLVAKNIDLSMALAEVIETTDIFKLLQSTEPTANDTKIVKEYIRAKMLPIFSEFMITELENSLNWDVQNETEAKQRIDLVLDELDTYFTQYKTHFVSSNQAEQKLDSKEEMNDLFTMVENFLEETDAYYQALKGLNISSLATKFDNDLEKYKKSNSLAEVYLEKIEQFVGYSLPNFLDTVLNVIY